jgi:uncharacterized protein with GYD domain
MPTFVSLVNWTDQGIKTYRDSVRRAEDYRGLVEESGGQVRQLVWTLGEYDIVVVTDFPDDETATAVALQTAALGNIRTTTMKAFDAEQMSAIPRHGSLPCEDKHGRLVTSGDAVMVLPTLAFAAVVCRLLSTGCRAFAACSPPVDTACGIRDGTLSAVAVRPVHDYLHHWRASR